MTSLSERFRVFWRNLTWSNHYSNLIKILFQHNFFPGYDVATIFAHAMSAELSFHGQKVLQIKSQEFGWEQNYISIEVKLRQKFLSERVPYNEKTQGSAAIWKMCHVQHNLICTITRYSAFGHKTNQWHFPLKSLSYSSSSGTHVTHDFSITIKIRWIFRFVLIQIWIKGLLQNFAHDTTA